MTVTAVQATYPRWQRALPPSAWQAHLWQIVVRVETSTGDVGHGYGGGGPAAVAVINGHLRELLLGRRLDGPDDIATLYADLAFATIPYGRGGLAQMALSGVDLACWDLLARAERKPVFELLGGVATAIPAYATSNNLDLVQQYGYIAMKLTHRWRTPADEDAVESKLAEARAALGPAARLMVDCYMSWDAAVARRLAARLRDYHVYWFEDVLTPDALTELAELRPQVKPIALAAGEHEMTEQGFALAAAAGAFDIWQPDVTWCGGISGALRILAVAAAARTPVVLHRGGEPWGLHLILATGCEKLAETMPERWQPDGEQLWLDEPQVVAGCIAPTDAPGFGVRLNQALL